MGPVKAVELLKLICGTPCCRILSRQRTGEDLKDAQQLDGSENRPCGQRHSSAGLCRGSCMVSGAAPAPALLMTAVGSVTAAAMAVFAPLPSTIKVAPGAAAPAPTELYYCCGYMILSSIYKDSLHSDGLNQLKESGRSFPSWYCQVPVGMQGFCTGKEGF